MMSPLELKPAFMTNLSQDAKDHLYMSEALRLAKKGVFTAQPNPRVGCVLVKNDEVIGRGWHRKAGEPHAEVYAIKQAGLLAKGATAYVTLEPCSHFGKTPPCANALIEAGVARVVTAMQDPNPSVAGTGLARLKANGIEVQVGVLAEQARTLNKGFMKRMESGLPWLSIKMAMSLDGRTAMDSGESQWITGPQARADVQRLRAECSAVLTGIGTLLHDDAALTVRAAQFDVKRFSEDMCLSADAGGDGVLLDEILQHQPLRVVMDSKARMSINSRLLEMKSPVLWVVSGGAITSESQKKIADLDYVEVLSLPDLSSPESLNQVLTHLASLACNEVLVEAGSTLAGSFVEAGLWDELIVYMAPKLLGSKARPLLNLPIDNMHSATPLSLKDIRQFGDDIRLIYQPADEHDAAV
tara:strand:- start:4642 stop:5880 length:1239 start_codon:yes stop_codon:yes gene_type:complete